MRSIHLCEVGKGRRVGNAVARRNEPIQPMTLGNMRRNGVRGLFVTCTACGRSAAACRLPKPHNHEERRTFVAPVAIRDGCYRGHHEWRTFVAPVAIRDGRDSSRGFDMVRSVIVVIAAPKAIRPDGSRAALTGC